MSRLLLAVFSALSFSASAQITVTDATFPVAGDILRYVFDNNPVNINPATPPGGNQVWDFSTLQNSQTAETAYLTASEGVNDGSFPGAELVTISPTAETYFNVTANKFEAMGYFGAAPLDLGLDVVATFSPAVVERRAPLQFFDISQSTSNLSLPFSVADLPDNPFQDAPFTPDSMRVRINIQRLDVVDGWGTCQIPGASYPVLRQKRTEYTTTNVDIKVSPLGWIDISQLGGGYFAGYLGTDTTVTFHFISGTEKEEIAIATMNNDLSVVESVQYKNTTPDVPPTCSITGADNVCNNTPGNIYTAPPGMDAYSWSISGNGTILGSTTGQSVSVTSGNYLSNYTVSVTITDANGSTNTCSKLSNIYLFTPPANITVNPNPACFGVTLDLSVAAAASSTVAWTGEGIGNPSGNPSTTALPASTGLKTYSVIITTDYGCSNTGTVNVMVNPNPTTPTITGPTAVCSGGSVTLDAGAGYNSYAWSNGGGSGQTANFSNITSQTTYMVTVTGANGCTSTDTHTVTVNPAPACSIIFTNPPPWAQDTTCANSTGNVYSAPGGMSAYNWSISGSGTITSATNGSSVTVTAGNSGSYNLFVTITDANGCTSTCSDQTPIKPAPTCSLSGPASVNCNSTGNVYSVSNGLFTISSYSWSVSGDAIISGPSNGSSVTVTAGTTNFTVNVTSMGFNACPSFCSQSVTVLLCPIDFSGKIIFSNNNSLGVNNATVSLTGSASGSDLSDTNGDFFISTAVSSGSFILKPAKTVNKLNGVTVGDITAIQQHVGNITLITDPYKLVAADVNKTNSINSVDASIINQSILGNPAALAQFKTSWRFVPTSHTMGNPPWGFPEQRTYTNINTNQTNQDFYGIKTGDVAVTFANPANFGAGQPLVLREKDQVLQAGETLTAAFSADQMDDLAAFQCAFRFDPAQLQFVEISPAEGESLPLTLDNFGTYNIAEGEIRVVWAQATGVAVSEAAPMFNIKFTALQSGSKLSEVLELDESELPAVSYTAALAESKLELKFSELTGTPPLAGQAGVQLLQNRPNPFNGSTTIGFVLPEACEAQLRVFDVSGKMLAEKKAQYPAGRYEEIFNLNGATGVLYYELTTPFGVLAKKMVATEK